MFCRVCRLNSDLVLVGLGKYQPKRKAPFLAGFWDWGAAAGSVSSGGSLRRPEKIG